MEKLKFSKKKFRNWLESKKESDIVGIRLDACRCPIHTFNSETSGYKIDSVYKEIYYYIKPNKIEFIKTPPWAFRFICKVDEVKLEDKQVTAKEALDILNSLK